MFHQNGNVRSVSPDAQQTNSQKTGSAEKKTAPAGAASVNLSQRFLALRAFFGLVFGFAFFAADGASPAAAFGKGGRSKCGHGDRRNG